MVTIPAMAAPASRIIGRQSTDRATAREGSVGGVLPGIVYIMVDTAVFPSLVPRLRVLGYPLLVQARPLNQ